MKRTVILAGNYREARQYCQDKEIRATFAKTSEQVRMADHLIELPGFAKRRDRFAMASSRDSRMTFGKNVEYTLESDWTPPAKVVEEVDAEALESDVQAAISPLYEIDLTDETVLEELKAQLKTVGLTLKKLPAKKQDAPVVDAPVEF